MLCRFSFCFFFKCCAVVKLVGEGAHAYGMACPCEFYVLLCVLLVCVLFWLRALLLCLMCCPLLSCVYGLPGSQCLPAFVLLCVLCCAFFFCPVLFCCFVTVLLLVSPSVCLQLCLVLYLYLLLLVVFCWVCCCSVLLFFACCVCVLVVCLLMCVSAVVRTVCVCGCGLCCAFVSLSLRLVCGRCGRGQDHWVNC